MFSCECKYYDHENKTCKIAEHLYKKVLSDIINVIKIPELIGKKYVLNIIPNENVVAELLLFTETTCFFRIENSSSTFYIAIDFGTLSRLRKHLERQRVYPSLFNALRLGYHKLYCSLYYKMREKINSNIHV